MNFAQAVNEMLAGKKVCLPAPWDGANEDAVKQYLIIQDDNIKLSWISILDKTRHFTRAVTSIQNENIKRTDWQIFEEKTPNQIKAEELEKQAQELLKKATDLRSSL